MINSFSSSGRHDYVENSSIGGPLKLVMRLGSRRSSLLKLA